MTTLLLLTTGFVCSVTVASPPPSSLLTPGRDTPPKVKPGVAPAVRANDIEYRVVAPRGLPDDAPLVIAIHGWGDSAAGFERFARRLALPARVIVPRGRLARAAGGRSWYPIRGPSRDAEVLRSLDHLSRLIDGLRKRWPKAGKPVVTGFSQGGVMSFALAARYPKEVRGAVPIAGYLPHNVVPDRTARVPVRAVHGRSDRRIEFSRGQAAVRTLLDAGFDATMAPFGAGHSIPAEATALVRRAIAELITPR